MSYYRHCLLGLIFLVLCVPAQAIITGELIMLRTDKAFPEAMRSLQDAIKAQGYVLSRIQQVDAGLTMSGYKTDKYRIVFFGKKDEFARLTEFYPELIPYMPLKIVIYAEAGETLLVTSDPQVFIDLYPDKRLKETFRKWHDDIIKIMKNVQNDD